MDLQSTNAACLHSTGVNDAGAPPKGKQMAAGALGKGLQFSSALVLTIKFVIAITPMFGAWLADAQIGRFRGILLGVVICALAHFVQIIGALPSTIHSGHALGPFLTGAFMLAIGAGKIVTPYYKDMADHRRYHSTLSPSDYPRSVYQSTSIRDNTGERRKSHR